MTRSNYYAVLGIDPGATGDQIEKAFRYLSELYADDALATYSILGAAEVRQTRAQLREAYDVLRNPVRRLEYDVRHGLIVAPTNGSTPPPGRSESDGLPQEVPSFEEQSEDDEDQAARQRAEPIVLKDPVNGLALKEFRSQRGISLREIADTTKIGLRYLEYIEGDRHSYLPAAVYLRGFLQEYAKAVGLDPRQTAEAYLAQCGKRDGD